LLFSSDDDDGDVTDDSYDPMEGGRGVIPPQYCGGIYKQKIISTLDRVYINVVALSFCPKDITTYYYERSVTFAMV
jgi:hypothetical protein